MIAFDKDNVRNTSENQYQVIKICIISCSRSKKMNRIEKNFLFGWVMFIEGNIRKHENCSVHTLASL